jgi:hypothetical protein
MGRCYTSAWHLTYTDQPAEAGFVAARGGCIRLCPGGREVMRRTAAV